MQYAEVHLHPMLTMLQRPTAVSTTTYVVSPYPGANPGRKSGALFARRHGIKRHVFRNGYDLERRVYGRTSVAPVPSKRDGTQSYSPAAGNQAGCCSRCSTGASHMRLKRWYVGWSIGVKSEQVVELLLGGVHLGQHVTSTWPATLCLIEKHRIFDAGKGGKQAAYTHGISNSSSETRARCTSRGGASLGAIRRLSSSSGRSPAPARPARRDRPRRRRSSRCAPW